MARKPITYERLIKRDRRHKTFRFFFTLLLIIAGVVFINHADSRLHEYELSQPVNVVNDFISSLSEKVSPLSSSVMTEETFAALSAFSRESSISFKEVVQPKKDELHYNLLAGNEVVGLFKLKERTPMGGEHFNRWEIVSVEQVVSSERIALELLKKLQNGDFSYIIDNTDLTHYPAETASDLCAYLMISTENKAFSLSEGNASDEEKEYIYLWDDQPFFTVYTKRDSSNKNIWRYSGCKAHFINPTVYTAEIPADITLYVNSVPAHDSWIVGTSQNAHAAHVAADVVNPVDLTIRHYEIPFAFTTPEFSLKDTRGNNCSFTLHDNKIILDSTGILSEFSFLEKDIKEATERIACFFVGKADIGRLLHYVEKGSNAYTIFHEYSLWKSLKAENASMNSIEIKNMTKLGDNCFVVEVNAHFKAIYSTTNQIDYPLHYVLYYHIQEGNWMIYDLVSN